MPGELLVGGDYERIDGTPRAPRAALGAAPQQAVVTGKKSEQPPFIATYISYLIQDLKFSKTFSLCLGIGYLHTMGKPCVHRDS